MIQECCSEGAKKSTFADILFLPVSWGFNARNASCATIFFDVSTIRRTPVVVALDAGSCSREEPSNGKTRDDEAGMILQDRPTGVPEHVHLRRVARFLHQDLGLAIIPVHHPKAEVPECLRASWNGSKHSGKRATVSWKKYQQQRPSESQIRRWFSGPILCNIAVVTGHPVGGANVVDLDSLEALIWAEMHLPQTPMRAITSEKCVGFYGEHWYYRAEAQHPLANRSKIRIADQKLDLDVRGRGGYVIAPGSLHLSGSRYRATTPWTPELLEQLPVLDLSSVAPPAPQTQVHEQVEFSGDLDQLAERARHWLANRPPAVQGSGGDGFTYSTAAFLLNDFALPEHVAWDLLLWWNRTCVPPWEERELRGKFDSAKRSPYRSQTYGRLRDAPLSGRRQRTGHAIRTHCTTG